MKKRGFTLIELLAVIVVLAIIALIATPIVMNIIKDAKEESNKRSVEMYAKALELSIAQYRLVNSSMPIGRYTTTDGKNLIREGETEPTLIVDYNGDVVFNNIVVFDDAEFYLSECSINGDDVDIEYGRILNFSTDSWETIVKYKDYGIYQVGDTKQIDMGELGIHTVRIANMSTPAECNTEGFSQSACGFVVEFADIIAQQRFNSWHTSQRGWEHSQARKYISGFGDCSIQGICAGFEVGMEGYIYNSLPEDLKQHIVDTTVISGYGDRDSANFTTTDNLYLLSLKEVTGSVNDDTASLYTRQLDYYANKGVTLTENYSYIVKQRNNSDESWWLRTPKSDNAFFYVKMDGVGLTNASVNLGISPAFRIG